MTVAQSLLGPMSMATSTFSNGTGSAWIDLAFPNSAGPSSEAHVRVDYLGRVVVA